MWKEMNMSPYLQGNVLIKFRYYSYLNEKMLKVKWAMFKLELNKNLIVALKIKHINMGNKKKTCFNMIEIINLVISIIFN